MGKPVERVVEIDEAVDTSLKLNWEENESKVTIVRMENTRLEGQVASLKAQCESYSHMQHEDWDHENKKLRKEIVELEAELLRRQQTHSGNLHEKVTTITYTEDPRAHELRRQIADLTSENNVLQQKISFHDKRTSTVSGTRPTATSQFGTTTVGTTGVSGRQTTTTGYTSSTVSGQTTGMVGGSRVGGSTVGGGYTTGTTVVGGSGSYGVTGSEVRRSISGTQGGYTTSGVQGGYTTSGVQGGYTTSGSDVLGSRVGGGYTTGGYTTSGVQGGYTMSTSGSRVTGGSSQVRY